METTEATTNPAPPPADTVAGATLVVLLGASYTDAPADQLDAVAATVREALGLAQGAVGAVTLAVPAGHAEDRGVDADGLHRATYVPTASAQALTINTAATWLALAGAMRAHNATAAIALGMGAQSLSPQCIAGMLDTVLAARADLAVPHYTIPEDTGLLNQAMLAPLSRALFAARVGFPLPLDFACSLQMAERMAVAAGRIGAAAQPQAVVWPVAEAAVAGFEVAEVGSTSRDVPPPVGDLSLILRDVAGSLFSEIEAKATFWQRTRPARETLRIDLGNLEKVPAEPVDDAEIDDVLATFRIGYSNLHDIWSLVLSPQTLVSLKRLSLATRENFSLPDTVWVRIVYDFVLAHRLRTLSRSHLLGALSPLYLAWVASHLLALRNGTATPGDALGRAFEADRPYLVSRWRWPDRFNP